ncbi:phosphate ABC transporter, permease protein PstC [Rubidibacter lacunae KORDI 51-2]|uniref:Phosphate transport system permease protein n=1 Tax=Rubidibacter lacunae KORDI 51-2 TaxID=582515 RepID=U5D8Z4_9CHRO|nr:phosphate ABC transporter permease subunit PstC [Rubidibacter lacunae]ERN41063.1 phosphate ABC transporter, permease protein PstC [Rubidibacter lacunae KORDI 51-2]
MNAPPAPKNTFQLPRRAAIELNLDRGFLWTTRIFAYSIAFVILAIGVLIIQRALPAIGAFGLGFIFRSAWNPVQDDYGALPMIAGTLINSAIALFFAIPLGIGSAIFLSEDFMPKAVRTPLVFLVELLAAIPSVVYGLWGIFVLIPLLRPFQQFLHDSFGWFPLFSTPPAGPGMFPASIVLSIMVLPIIIAISRDSLAQLPPELRQASLGLGATRWGTIFRVLLPAAFSGIVGGIMLALGRAMGETMAVTMLVGNSNRLSASLFAPANTIASLIANQFAEASGLQVAALMYAGLVLFALTFVVNVLAESIVRQVKKF